MRDAKALLDAGQWSGAYYLAGYAVECGLKACIAKQINQHDFPDRNLAQKCYTHNIEALIVVANLKTQLDADATVNVDLGDHWATVKDWDEQARYQQWTEQGARNLFEAVTDAANGVLPWIKARW